MARPGLHRPWVTWGPVVSYNKFVHTVPLWGSRYGNGWSCVNIKQLIEDDGRVRQEVMFGINHRRSLVVAYGGPLFEV